MDTNNILHEDWKDFHTVYLIRYSANKETHQEETEVRVHGIYEGETNAKAAAFDATLESPELHVLVRPTSAPLKLPH